MSNYDLLNTTLFNNNKLTPNQINSLTELNLDDNTFYEIFCNLNIVQDIDLYINSLIKNPKNEIIFNETLFNEQKQLFFDEHEHMRRSNIVLKGLPCSFCKSVNTKAKFEQTRSADEGMSFINECFTCGKSK